MPQQFTVPQFLDAEDKIMGPITIRQFVILLTAFLTDAILYKLLPFVAFIIVGLVIIMLAGILAFVKINGMPFHFFILNLIQTFKRPQLRVWDKNLNDSELREFFKKEKEAPPPPLERKAPVSRSRLNELTLVVNTGGLYKPEGE